MQLLFRKLIRTFLFIISVCSVLSCANEPSADTTASANGVIPKPVSVMLDGGVFLLTESTTLVVDPPSPEAENIARYFATWLTPSTGFDLKMAAPGTDNAILFAIGGEEELGEEGYELTVQSSGVTLLAFKPAGLFRGVQTLRQLLPDKSEVRTVQEGPWEIATGTIRDQPSYQWRGSMLDVARHFFSVDDVKQYIDFIAAYKMNALHLHLTDDQGWRIEIKSWPNLTTHGGSTQVEGGAGGFYTQDEYKEIVAYALERYITVVPEVDLPGHINAALASYAELNCNGKATELYTGIEVGFSTLCLKKEVTFKFVDDVMGELAAMTPGPYLHVGGDEAAVTPKPDYIEFVGRFQEIVERHGKKMIGWEEIAQGSINENAVAQHWHSSEMAQGAVSKGAKVILSPASRVYLDMKYDSLTSYGMNWAGYVEVDRAYDWDPATVVPGLAQGSILGVEAPLWSEMFSTMDQMEYLLFPRLPGVAEVAWTPTAERNWEEYRVRLARHGKRMEVMGIGFYRSPKVPWSGQ